VGRDLLCGRPLSPQSIVSGLLLAEFAAAAGVAVRFPFAEESARHRRPRDIAGLAGAYALLILTHLPLTVIGSIGPDVLCVAARRPKENCDVRQLHWPFRLRWDCPRALLLDDDGRGIELDSRRQVNPIPDSIIAILCPFNILTGFQSTFGG